LHEQYHKGTALITGASSGIGEAFARRLAAQGYDLILVARRAAQLQAIATELEAKHPVAVAVLPADLTEEREIGLVEAAIRQQEDLTLLVNNAGFGTTGYFADIALEQQLGMIQVHVNATVRLCRAALPGMIERGAGNIINVASISAYFPNPGTVTYCATKSFLVTFSEGLQEEVRQHGITVQALCPGFTYTGFHSAEHISNFDQSDIPRFLWMPAEPVVEESLEALAKEKTVVIPGIRNKLLVFAARNDILRMMLKLYRVVRPTKHQRALRNQRTEKA
jgi:short-subunit dehydrogenase